MGWFISAVLVLSVGLIVAAIMIDRRRNARCWAQFALLAQAYGLALEPNARTVGGKRPRVSGTMRGRPGALAVYVREHHPMTLLYLQAANPADLDFVIMTKPCPRWSTFVNLVNHLAKRPQDAKYTATGDAQLDDAIQCFTQTAPRMLPVMVGPLKSQLLHAAREFPRVVVAVHGQWLYACYDNLVETDAHRQDVERLVAWLAEVGNVIDRHSADGKALSQ